MSADKLASELLSLDPTDDESTAAMRLAAAYANFASEAESNGVPMSSAAVSAGMVAMQPALAGMSSSGQGASIISGAIITFWSSVVPLGFPGATAGTPPPHAGLQAALSAAFASNTESGIGKQDALQLIANAMHSQAIIGGACTFPGPTIAPIL